MSMPALDALDRERTVVLVTVSPLEQHGPHLPLGVDAFTASHFATQIAERLVADRPGWSAVLAPPLYLISAPSPSRALARCRSASAWSATPSSTTARRSRAPASGTS
jgi:creatinine amidohydrolase/Fe(II)-dependent formamide hydrolase-like protein